MDSSVSPISVDLLHAASRSESFPKDWPPERRAESLSRYRRFFALLARYPERPLAPTADIDEFWHLHMLHPVAYASDCERAAGRIIDHNGGFGSTDAEAVELAEVFEATAQLWLQEYGEEYGGGSEGAKLTKCDRNCVSRCWHKCSSISG